MRLWPQVNLIFVKIKSSPQHEKQKTILVLLQVSHRSWHLGQRSNRTRPQTTFITMIVLNWGMPARTTNHHIALWSYGTPKVKCQACVKPMCNATWLSHVEGAVHHVKRSKKRTRKIHKRNFTEVESSRNGSASGSLARGLCLYLGFNRRLRTKICHARNSSSLKLRRGQPKRLCKRQVKLENLLMAKMKRRVGGSPPLMANGLVKAAAATAHSSSTLQRSEAKPRKHREYLSRS